MILDTAALVRLLQGTLPEEVLLDLEEAETLAVSAATLFEINQEVRIGRLEVPSLGAAQVAALEARGIAVLPLDAEVAGLAAAMPWTHAGRDHRDPFDRMIAATALLRRLPVVTGDPAFRDLAGAGLRMRGIGL